MAKHNCVDTLPPPLLVNAQKIGSSPDDIDCYLTLTVNVKMFQPMIDYVDTKERQGIFFERPVSIQLTIII